MDMELYTEDEVVWVKLEGRLDISGTESVEETFHSALQEAVRGAVIDLKGVDFITSMGLRMLMTSAHDLLTRGAHLIVLNPQWRVRESLEISGLTKVIPIAESSEEVTELLQT